VNVYRFVSKDTIEEEIIERAKRKMVLEYAIIKQMDTSGKSVMQKGGIGPSSGQHTGLSKEELQTILKFGAKNLFKHEVAETSDVDVAGSSRGGDDGAPSVAEYAAQRLEELNFDNVLARAEESETNAVGAGATDGGAEFLEQWRIADVGVNELSWNEIIPEKERKKTA
jgi:chromodomain-helicase-DNA-binding protein 1